MQRRSLSTFQDSQSYSDLNNYHCICLKKNQGLPHCQLFEKSNACHKIPDTPHYGIAVGSYIFSCTDNIQTALEECLKHVVFGSYFSPVVLVVTESQLLLKWVILGYLLLLQTWWWLVWKMVHGGLDFYVYLFTLSQMMCKAALFLDGWMFLYCHSLHNMVNIILLLIDNLHKGFIR